MRKARSEIVSRNSQKNAKLNGKLNFVALVKQAAQAASAQDDENTSVEHHSKGGDLETVCLPIGAVPEAETQGRDQEAGKKAVNWNADDEDEYSPFDDGDPNGESKSPNTSKPIQIAEWSGDNGFELRNVWQSKELEVTPVATMLANFDMSDSGSDLEEENEEKIKNLESWRETVPSSINRCLKPFLINPNSRFKILWDFFGFLSVLYDCIMIPVSFFDYEIEEIGWINRIFWTVDLIVYPLTAYSLQDGKLQDQPLKIIRHSLQGQIFKNIPLVAIDWVNYLVGAKTAKLGKIAKAFRMTRLLRLWHLINTKELPESIRAIIEHYFSSAMGQTVFSIVKLLCVIVWINHVLACLWYYVASRDDGDDHNWVYLYGINQNDKQYIYVTALHWSITQFFCGAAPVGPTNFDERTFNVIVLFFSIMMSAFIISSLTTSMTRLSIVAAEEAQKFAALRDYLSQNNISARVALRVQRNARFALQELMRHTPEQNIDLLSLVSQPLRIELHFEVHMPALAQYPFFDMYRHDCPELLRSVCHEAVSQVALSQGDLVFSQGVDNVNHMYFLVAGKLAYVQADMYDDVVMGQRRTIVPEGAWACEAAFFTEWVHCGSMRAKAESQLKIVTIDLFLELAKKYKAFMSYPRGFGHRYMSFINKKKPTELSDLAYDDFDYREIAVAIHTKRGRKRSNVRVSDGKSIIPSASVHHLSSDHSDAADTNNRSAATIWHPRRLLATLRLPG